MIATGRAWSRRVSRIGATTHTRTMSWIADIRFRSVRSSIRRTFEAAANTIAAAAMRMIDASKPSPVMRQKNDQRSRCGGRRSGRRWRLVFGPIAKAARVAGDSAQVAGRRRRVRWGRTWWRRRVKVRGGEAGWGGMSSLPGETSATAAIRRRKRWPAGCFLAAGGG